MAALLFAANSNHDGIGSNRGDGLDKSCSTEKHVTTGVKIFNTEAQRLKNTETHKGNHKFRFAHYAPLVDVLWLLALAVYILAGISTVPFHGDEAMQITMSRDFFTAFVNRQPQALIVRPPYSVDSPNWLRLINGSVNPYMVGLSLQVAGYGEKDLPPVWIWPLSYDENVTRGNRPTQGILIISRVSSAIFLAVSAAVLFGIGWQMRERWVGYLASGLYALNPVVLLNGRRAMMEGSVLGFGLLTILVAILICKGRNSWRWWVALGVASGLTVASKHSGIVFVAAAFGWVLIRLIQNNGIKPQRRRDYRVFQSRNHEPQIKKTNTEPPPQPSPASDGGSGSQQNSGFPREFEDYLVRKSVLREITRIGVSLIVMVGIFIALSPAQWNNPVERFGDLVSERAKLLESQVKAEPSAPTAMSERITGIITQPYMEAPIYFEAAFWRNSKAIQDEIAQYDASIWSGLHAGTVIGGLLTILAMIGIVIVARGWRTWEIGVLVWLAVTVTSLLVNPLPWQRYYLALYPLATLLTAIGTVTLMRWLGQLRSST